MAQARHTESAPHHWDEQLRARGYRATPQRQLVLEAVATRFGIELEYQHIECQRAASEPSTREEKEDSLFSVVAKAARNSRIFREFTTIRGRQKQGEANAP